MLIVNRNDSIAGGDKGRRGRGDVQLRAKELGTMEMFNQWRSQITFIKPPTPEVTEEEVEEIPDSKSSTSKRSKLRSKKGNMNKK